MPIGHPTKFPIGIGVATGSLKPQRLLRQLAPNVLANGNNEMAPAIENWDTD